MNRNEQEDTMKIKNDTRIKRLTNKSQTITYSVAIIKCIIESFVAYCSLNHVRNASVCVCLCA